MRKRKRVGDEPFVAAPWGFLERALELLDPLYERLFLRLLRDCNFEAGWRVLRRGGRVWLDAGETLFASKTFGPRQGVDRQTALRFRRRLERLGWISVVPPTQLLLGPARRGEPGGIIPIRPCVPLPVPLGVPHASVVRVEKWRRIIWPAADTVPLPVPQAVPVLPFTNQPRREERSPESERPRPAEPPPAETIEPDPDQLALWPCGVEYPAPPERIDLRRLDFVPDRGLRGDGQS